MQSNAVIVLLALVSGSPEADFHCRQGDLEIEVFAGGEVPEYPVSCPVAEVLSQGHHMKVRKGALSATFRNVAILAEGQGNFDVSAVEAVAGEDTDYTDRGIVKVVQLYWEHEGARFSGSVCTGAGFQQCLNVEDCSTGGLGPTGTVPQPQLQPEAQERSDGPGSHDGPASNP